MEVKTELSLCIFLSWYSILVLFVLIVLEPTINCTISKFLLYFFYIEFIKYCLDKVQNGASLVVFEV